MGQEDKQRNLRHECNTGRVGELTVDRLAECVQELRDAGVPGRARVKVDGDGVRTLGFSVTALWSSPPAEPDANPYRKMNLDAIAEEIRIAEGKQPAPGEGETLQP